MQPQKKNIFNILLIGGQGAGKSTLLSQIVKNTFPEYYMSTMGIDVGEKKIEMDNIQYELIFWDTPGQERFQNISTSYYKKADCCVIIYNLNDQEECENVKDWINQFQQHYSVNKKEQCPIIIVGNIHDQSKYQKNDNSLSNYQRLKVCLKYSFEAKKVLEAIVNATILKQHENVKTLTKIQQNPVCQKFKNLINDDIQKIDDISKIVDQSKDKMLLTFNQLIGNLQLWKKEMLELQQNYQNQDFLQKIEQSNYSDELFIQQEQVQLNDQMRQVNQNYAQKFETSLQDIQNFTAEAVNLKIEFKKNQPQI